MKLCGEVVSMHERDSTNDLVCLLQEGHKGPCSPWLATAGLPKGEDALPKLGLKLPPAFADGREAAPAFAGRRKVVQIATMGVDCLFVLCDDATVWQMLSRGEGWMRVKDVPQPEGA
jgi:hypothetical protein